MAIATSGSESVTASTSTTTSVTITTMRDWIPFLQSIVWPLFVLILLFRFRKYFEEILSAIGERIKQGDDFEASGHGIKLKAPKVGRKTEGGITKQHFLKPQTTISSGPTSQKVEGPELEVGEIVEGFYLVHSAKRDKSLDKDDKEYYRLKISLDADEEKDLDQIKKVVYHLHPTFRNPVRETMDRDSNFEITTIAWGQFLLVADIYFKGIDKPLTTERYINF
jgi:YEATS family